MTNISCILLDYFWARLAGEGTVGWKILLFRSLLETVFLLRNALLLPGGRKEGSKELQTERSVLLEFGIKDSGWIITGMNECYGWKEGEETGEEQEEREKGERGSRVDVCLFTACSLKYCGTERYRGF
jgi:hypothetical protein